ncbi:putative dynactin Arp1 p25 subunit RO12 [Mycosarcoma maydis]|uniref:Dynactin subunit 5 n=1 Tax=Mycosarcoma maydis TaxID=5270 RepID=A0A0D1E0I3_MYCMD|nr:putative dynactin Arp1 p25 subunit RO12 [Ustilago maydis 521]KIS69724.1 putative dynactin Arp1 p25 subunit RO12 [Ustilago maydis 521]|eukprot:XP_011388809.1 putative dynactin Arp1 p25 subunit RO12 [Ustilago maydis 521]
MPSTISHVSPYHPNEYVQTALTGNKVSRKATILGSQNIILGGKCIIQHGAIIRGDLKRISPSSTSSTAVGSQTQPAQSVAIFIGRYCILAESSVIRPPYKTYKGIFSYYPMKMGDHVSVGANTVLEAASVGSHVEIGANCLVGRFVIIKDCARILDGSVVAPNTVIPSFSIFGGSPARLVGELPETFSESCEAKMKHFYQRFRPANER